MAQQQQHAIDGLKNLVLAADGSEYSEGAVREAIAWAQRYGSTLHIVSVAELLPGHAGNDRPDGVAELEKATREAAERVKARAEAAGVRCERVVHVGEQAYTYIADEADKQQADAIIMGQRGLRGLMKMLVGSCTALTIGCAPCPVFVVPPAGRLLGQYLLVATDGSDYSEQAAKEAIQLAGCTGGRILACSVALGDADEWMAENNVKRVCRMAEEQNIECESIVPRGRPYEWIIELASERDADTIVTGTLGRTGLEKLVMGSVAERVIGLSERTVMVVRQQA